MGYTTTYVVLTLIVIIASTVLSSDRLTRWCKLKKYQYEATFALSMMNPRERFVCSEFTMLLLVPDRSTSLADQSVAC